MTKTNFDTIVVDELDPSFREEVASMPGGANIKQCYGCGTCAAGCPVTDVDEEYNCRTIIRKILFGMREEVLKSPAIWLCAMCYRCYARCPQQVNFTDIMRALRYMAVRDGFASADMLAKEDAFEKKAHTLRRDLVRGAVSGKKSPVKKTVSIRTVPAKAKTSLHAKRGSAGSRIAHKKRKA
ncbi:MAG TPA: 4Fe-4S dicluster domain-containing protein [Chitinivibrionales bacterium]